MLSIANWRVSRRPLAPSADLTATSRAPRHAAREQQVGDVGAGDEQDQADGREEHEQRRPYRAEDDVGKRLDEDAAGPVLRDSALELRGDARRAPPAPPAAPPAQPSEDEDGMGRPRQRRGVVLQRQPDVDRGARAAVRERARRRRRPTGSERRRSRRRAA